jgi:Protein kinase domain
VLRFETLMTDDTRLANLLLEWETALERGEPVSPEELCRDWPEGLDELRQRVRRLRTLAPVLSLEEPGGRGGKVAASHGGPPRWPSVAGYEILGELGQGGMGVVYRARDRALGRVVALKVLRPGLAPHWPMLRRFAREARALARLRHDNIVPIYEARLHRGQPYFAMEFVPGGSLAGQLHRFVGNPVAAVTLLHQVAHAVQHAHERGVLHRDLKPANILLDLFGRPLVSDFGLARLLEPGSTEDWPTPPERRPPARAPSGGEEEDLAPLTAVGVTLGTPPYMAPEQFSGSGGAVTARTDVWALGVILNELLTGQRPFHATATKGFATVVEEASPDPPRSLQPGIDPRLEAVVLRCLEKDPARRYPTAAAVGADLERWLRGESAEALAGSPAKGLLWRARYWGLAGAVFLCAALATLAPAPPGRQAEPTTPGVRVADVEEESYRLAVQPRQEELKQRREARLVGPDAQGLAWRCRAGDGRARVVEDGEGRRVLVTASAAALVELVPDFPLTDFRIEAEVRHEAFCNNFADVGLYCAYSHCLTEEGPQHFFIKAGFADLGPRASTFQDDLGRRGSEFQLGPWHHGTSSTKPNRVHFFHPLGVFYSPPERPMQGPGPWRPIRLEVRPKEIRADWEGREMHLALDTILQEWLPALRRQYPDLAARDLDLPVRGAMGIYIYGGSLSVRRLVIEPLPVNHD